MMPQRLFLFFLAGFAVTLPIGSKINNYFLAAFGFSWLCLVVNNRLYNGLLKSREFWLASGLFFIYAISLFYSQNLKMALTDLEHKLALLIFPLLLLTKVTLSKKTAHNILLIFAFACTSVSAYLFAAGLYRFVQTKSQDVFFYHAFASTAKMHAVYLSVYFSLASFILIHWLRHNSPKKTTIKALIGAGILLLTLAILFLSSKTIIIFYFGLLAAFTVLHYYRQKQAYLGLGLALALGVGITLAVVTLPNIKQRINNVAQSQFSVLNQEKFEYDTPFTGLTLRLLFWKYAWVLVDREDAWLWGLGTGDSQDALNKKYLEHNLYSGNINNGPQDIGYQYYNTHNQFVETFLKTGLIGLTFLSFYFFRILYISYQRRAYLYFAFLILFIAFSLTESTLQGNKGILFFAFVNCLFLSYLSSNKQAVNSKLVL